jgi:hypothetical protein
LRTAYACRLEVSQQGQNTTLFFCQRFTPILQMLVTASYGNKWPSQ